MPFSLQSGFVSLLKDAHALIAQVPGHLECTNGLADSVALDIVKDDK